jgi:GH15 family glucan-1,4-alpha-glucosidase
MAQRIEDYGVIGDCETAALVGKDGSIDWLCWPNFASDACFAALLGDEGNGRWLIAPAAPAPDEEAWEATWRYLPQTLVLETKWTRGEDIVCVTDFMPSRGDHSHIARKVECVQGEAAMHTELCIRFDYGRSIPWVTSEARAVRAIAGPHMMVLRTNLQTHGKDERTVSDFTVSEGEHVWLTLSYAHSAEPEPAEIDPDVELEEAKRYWAEWASKCTSVGRYTEAVQRSLITLKALTYRPTGGVVAAVTTSLPEALGGPRNWDYRFCWLRDSTFTLLALMNGGFYKEAEAWQDWLLRAIAGSPEQVQIMYGIAGERNLLEWEATWLSGYENSKPVRIGNAAAEQLQLDIYGEVMDAFFHALASVKGPRKVDLHLQGLLIGHLLKVWKEPDQGIWETRSGPQHFTYSKMMVWVALDRAIAIAEHTGSDVPLDEWRAVRDEVHAEVCKKGFNKKIGAFTQVYGGDALDSSLLLMPQVGFLPPTDPRVKGTIEAIEAKLMRDGLLLRYDTGKSADGLPEGEGAFLACSFWMVSCLKMIGREADARKLLERLLSLRNDLGLLSEEYDTGKGRQVGNFPQAFSHIAMVNAIFDVEGGEQQLRARHERRTRAARPAAEQEVAGSTPELDPHPSNTVSGEGSEQAGEPSQPSSSQ